jgi:hypothetical protein
MRLELAERKFKNRTGELTQYLEVSMCALNTYLYVCSEHITKMTFSKNYCYDLAVFTVQH